MKTKRLLYPVMVVGLLAIPAAILGFLALLHSEFAQIGALRAEVDEAVAVRAGLAQLLSEHQDVETGQRGYVISGDRAFLEPYEIARRRIDTTFAQLHARSAGDSEMAAGLTRLGALSRRKLAFAADAVALAGTGAQSPGRVTATEGTGKAIMDAIRREIAQLDRVQERRLAALSGTRDSAGYRLERAMDLLLAGFALLLALVAAVFGRLMRERQRALASTRALASRQQAVFDSAVDGMLVLDAAGYIRDLNPSVVRLFGYAREELVGSHNTALMANPPSLEASQAWLRTVSGAGERGAGERREFTGRRSTGEIFETDVSVSRFDDAGQPAFVAVVRDVTERKRMETLKSDFVATVSHELRTPLTSIGGSLGLLASGAVGALDAKAARLVAIAHSNCERLIRLINDILDIEKIESGQMAFDFRRMTLAPLIERTLTANRAFAESHGVELTMVLPPWPQCVSGDPDRLEQLLTNLVSNAIKHSPTGGTVEITTVADGAMVRLEVADRGGGVPQAFRNRIFGKFAMADSSDARARGGTGLGLSIAREIAERHGGTVGYRDRAGGGTVFYLVLPLLEAALPAASETLEDLTAQTGLPTILHVDDDHDTIDVVASAFANRARLIPAESLAAAREILAQDGLAAVIIDVGMGSCSGLDLVPEIRKLSPPIPVVLFTAHDAGYKEVGVDAVLVKSRTPLNRLVQVTLGHVRQTEESPL